MKQNKLLLSALALLAGGVAAADDGLTMTVSPEQGTPQTVAVAAGDILEFSETGMALMTGDVQKASFSWPQLQTLTFNVPTSVDRLLAGDAMRPLRNPVEDVLEMTCPPEQPCALYISNTGGALVLRVNAWNGEPVDVSSLSAGIYLVTVNNSTFKIIKK